MAAEIESSFNINGNNVDLSKIKSIKIVVGETVVTYSETLCESFGECYYEDLIEQWSEYLTKKVNNDLKNLNITINMAWPTLSKSARLLTLEGLAHVKGIIDRHQFDEY